MGGFALRRHQVSRLMHFGWRTGALDWPTLITRFYAYALPAHEAACPRARCLASLPLTSRYQRHRLRDATKISAIFTMR